MSETDQMIASRVANRFIQRHTRVKTAGEVRFIKDRSGDDKQWGWGQPGPSTREISEEFEFDAKNLKPLSKVLRSCLSAMGYSLSAYDGFTRIKSSTISPDGSLGGKGYIQKIAEMRRAFMNVIESLSAISDTIHDEMKAPHWNPAVEKQSPREREEVKSIMNDVNGIEENPEEWAEDAEQDEFGDEGGEDPNPDETSAEEADPSDPAPEPLPKKKPPKPPKSKKEASGMVNQLTARYLFRSAQ